MNYILAAILTNIGWATGDIFGAKSARKIGGENTAFWVVLLSTVIVVPLALLQGWPQLTLEIIFLSLVLAVIIEIAYFCFTKALEIGNPPLVGAITGAFPAIVVVLSVLFFNESLNSQQVLAVALTIFGIILSSINLKQLKTRKVKIDKSITYSLVSFVLWGVYFTFIAVVIDEIGAIWANALTTVIGIPVLWLILHVSGVKIVHLPKDNPKALKYIIPTVLLSGGAMILYNYAVNAGQSSIVAPIAGAYPALFVLLSYFVFEEKLNRQQLSGVVLALTGVIALSVLG